MMVEVAVMVAVAVRVVINEGDEVGLCYP
jgi:hypothetical protein